MESEKSPAIQLAESDPVHSSPHAPLAPIFPRGAAEETAVAIFCLFAWLTLFSYVMTAPPALQLGLTVLWIAAFVWLHVFRPTVRRRRASELGARWDEIPLAIRRSPLVLALSLSLVTAISLPWWGAFLTGGCARSEWFENVWRADTTFPLGNTRTPTGLLLALLGTAAVPLVEEFTFRGWLLRSWAKRVGLKWAVVLTSVFFAIGHVDFHGGLLFGHFVFGVIAAGAVIVSGSVWPAVAMHYSYNFANGLMHTPSSLHSYFGRLFGTSLFRCGSSAAIFSVSIAVMVGLLVQAQRVKRTAA